MRIRMWIDNDNDMQTGSAGFLIEISPQGRATRTVLREQPGRTNQSRERRLSGWLGNTNNVVARACGLARVARLNAAGDRALVEVLTGAALAEALGELGHPDLAPEETRLTTEVDQALLTVVGNPRLPVKGRTPTEPITISGWYEHTDGTVGEYAWSSGRCRIVDCRARRLSADEERAEHLASESDEAAHRTRTGDR